MDNDWTHWLIDQAQQYDLDADHILRHSIYYNALHSSGIEDLDHSKPQPITTYWNGLDSPAAYQRHLGDPDKAATLARYGWIDADIRYDLNSWGFRSPGCVEYDTITEPSFIAMGCSYTFGTGLPQRMIWPQICAEELGLKLINLATAGHGLAMNTQWLLTQGHTLKDPRVVVIFMPPSGRLTWYQRVPGTTPYTDHLVGNTFSMTQWERVLPIKENIKYNAHMDYVKNYAAIQLWCDSRQIPLHVFTGAGGDPSTYGLARDLAHQGRGWHRALAQRVLEHTKDLQTTRAKSS